MNKTLKSINKGLKEAIELSKGNSLVITPNGKPAGILLSTAELDDLRQTKQFVESIAIGLSDSEKGELFSTNQVKTFLKTNYSK